jgi:hypothetical protein
VSKNGVTNVYTIQHGEEYDWMLPIDRDDYELLIFDGKPRASSWKPVAMRRLKDFRDGRPSHPCDFPCGSGGTYLIMSEAAKEKIGSHLKRYGEFLPLRCDEGNFLAFHVTHFVDALDEDASDVLRSPDDPNVVLMIHKHAFQPEKLTADWMFKLPQSRGRSRIYVTDPFVDLIRTSGLTGLEFKRVWPHS